MSKFALVFSFMVFVLSCSFARAVGFSSGEEFHAYTIAGEVSLRCVDVTQNYSCRTILLEPAMADHFEGPAGVDADSVVLSIGPKRASKRAVRTDYNSDLGRTRAPVNLWRSNFFQSPLLRVGKNELSYKMLKAGKQVATGKFKVQVQKLGEKTCPSGQLEFLNPDDCRKQFTACQKYFEANNYCR